LLKRIVDEIFMGLINSYKIDTSIPKKAQCVSSSWFIKTNRMFRLIDTTEVRKSIVGRYQHQAITLFKLSKAQ